MTNSTCMLLNSYQTSKVRIKCSVLCYLKIFSGPSNPLSFSSGFRIQTDSFKDLGGAH